MPTPIPAMDRLAIYYGYPSLINGATGVAAAAAEFASYDLVVLGGGLEDPAHPDHTNTITIIGTTGGPDYYGYVPLGNVNVGAGLPQAEILQRIQAWSYMGVKGVLLDEFGYDYGVTRTRQNAAVDECHSLGLEAFANGWVPADVLDPAVVTLNSQGGGNPTGIATSLGGSSGIQDHCLIESYLYQFAAFEGESEWTNRMTGWNTYAPGLGIKLHGVTTTTSTQAFVQAHHDYCWYGARIYDLASFAWGEFDYSANSQLTLRTLPTAPTGDWNSSILDAATQDAFPAPNNAKIRVTTTGYVTVDYLNHVGSFI